MTARTVLSASLLAIAAASQAVNIAISTEGAVNIHSYVNGGRTEFIGGDEQAVFQDMGGLPPVTGDLFGIYVNYGRPQFNIFFHTTSLNFVPRLELNSMSSSQGVRVYSGIWDYTGFVGSPFGNAQPQYSGGTWSFTWDTQTNLTMTTLAGRIGVVPEPAGIVISSLGMVGLIRRRRSD